VRVDHYDDHIVVTPLQPISIEVPKHNKVLKKIVAITLRMVRIAPCPGHRTHRLSQNEISACTGLSTVTIRESTHQFEEEGAKGLFRRERRITSLPKEIVTRIVELQIEDPLAGCAVIATKLQEETNIQVDHEEVALVLSRVDYNQIRPQVRELAKGPRKTACWVSCLVDLYVSAQTVVVQMLV
jgi:transposase